MEPLPPQIYFIPERFVFTGLCFSSQIPPISTHLDPSLPGSVRKVVTRFHKFHFLRRKIKSETFSAPCCFFALSRVTSGLCLNISRFGESCFAFKSKTPDLLSLEELLRLQVCWVCVGKPCSSREWVGGRNSRLFHDHVIFSTNHCDPNQKPSYNFEDLLFKFPLMCGRMSGELLSATSGGSRSRVAPTVLQDILRTYFETMGLDSSHPV